MGVFFEVLVDDQRIRRTMNELLENEFAREERMRL